MIDEILHLDRELFLYLNNLGNPVWDQSWLVLSNKWSAIPIYVMLLLICLKQLGLRRTLILAVAVALMVTTTDQLSNFFKYGVQRLRPCFDPEVAPFMRLVQESCGGKFGFYSAHAANTMGVAFLFTSLLKSPGGILGITLITWAFLVGISRIFIGVHYPLDVLTGMLIGLLFSWLFARLYIFAIHKYHV